jgi:uroporphyrinogen-III synthase
MRLAVLRPADRLEESVALAREMGFDTIAASPLVIMPNRDENTERMINALKRDMVDHVVITSSAGVASVLALAKASDADIIGLLNRCKVTAIGPATAQSMTAAGIRVDMMPGEFTSTGLVEMLTSRDISGRTVCLLRSDHGDPILVTGLQDAGATVIEVAIYKLVPRPEDESLVAMVRESLAGNVDAFAFPSALTAATFIEAADMLGAKDELIAMLNGRQVVAIGPPTRKRLEGMGVRVDIMPRQATFQAMLDELKRSPTY